VRRIAPLDLAHLARSAIAHAPPRFETLAPQDLWIDERYQRDLSARSVRLIGKMVARWDWARFRPPVGCFIEGAVHLIDGQHTAIAAATHGGIAAIPVAIVEAATLAQRARAFVGLNRDRIQATGAQIYFAELAAGDDEAATVAQVCARAGVTLLKYPPPMARFKPGDTLAISTLRRLIDKHGAMRARVVLETLVKARCAPLAADLIRAAAELLYAPEYDGLFTQESLSVEIRALGDAFPAAARRLAEERGMTLWRALASHLAHQGGRHVARPAA